MRTIGIGAVLALVTFAAVPERTAAGPGQGVDVAGAKQGASAAGTAWLALVDGERYAESWAEASTLFRQQVGRDQWVEMARSARAAVGALRGRTFDSATYVDGNAAPTVVLLWKSRFDAVPEAVEQVTMMMDGGRWRVAGYFVRPG
ncbi:DUF4019 domain-containing protein [Anaeromyxobacter sp. PSR-1]|uniref:DUF4019 domain-containing protein n=1 Tax=Anaeromyxobacter sp. PSR-1 TaxID=1300915 RepID=UPI0005DD9765|nr:DUF4019 domain-containing protein [Anaeromyxobacter sp. PSR-1]GAO01913.1 hypothetical protein PSR1_00775 [Anaeromyxobacter sp. PSR-1]